MVCLPVKKYYPFPRISGIFLEERGKNSVDIGYPGYYNENRYARESSRDAQRTEYRSDDKTGRYRPGGAEGAAKTLRHKGPVLDETPESEVAPKRQSAPLAENLSGYVTEAQTLAYAQGSVSSFFVCVN